MPRERKRLVVAMSGGVDSSVAAALCLEQGHEVIGVTLKLKDCNDSRERRKACCGLDDYIHVRLAADTLGIPHYFLDLREAFRRDVLEYAWRDYSAGRTPNPCAMCNFHLKFGALVDYAVQLGADGIVTGHYALLDHTPSGPRLYEATDSMKNQAYFLCLLNRAQLDLSYMPLGTMRKSQVREKAAELGLENANKQESQDACFGYKGEIFADTLAHYFGAEGMPGEIVDDNGAVLGAHDGIYRYTIGQRKGLGVALGRPGYVAELRLETNQVVLSTDPEKIMNGLMTVENINWICPPAASELKCEVQIRYRQQPEPATVKTLDTGRAVVEFDRLVRAIAPGQVAAFWNGRELLGGGFIA